MATLFVAMLRSLGMTAHPVLIRTRSQGEVLVGFASSQFNHVIACVPLGQDTLWLDCTCNYCPFGELPWYDEGCHTLVVMDHTAALITTPTSTVEENKLKRSIHATLAQDASLEIEGTITARGNYESHYREFLNSSTAKERKEWLVGLIGRYAPNHTLLSHDFENLADSDFPLSVEFTAKLIRYATVSGNEFLLNLNLLSRVDAEEIPRETERKYPVDNQYAYTTEDEVTLDYPEKFAVKVVPEDEENMFPFASFQARYSADGGRLTYRRTRTATQRLIPPTSFGEYKEFLERAYRSDHSFVVLTKAE
jgi:hypothetical protein